MNQKFKNLHTFNFIFRGLTWILLYVMFRVTGMIPVWMSTLICVVCLVLEMVVHYGYSMRDYTNDRVLAEKISTMPLYDLIEAINKRDDIKKIVINEAEGSDYE